MTPEQKIRYQLVLDCIANDYFVLDKELIDADIDDIIDEYEDEIFEYAYNFRCGEIETHIRKESSRHYESKSVATKLWDGTWVGWTYWYGGGKHGEPEAIDWMDSAYFLNCEEKEVLQIVRTFKKV